MSTGRETPAPKRITRKQKKIRVQIGDDLDFMIGLYVSRRAVTLVGSTIVALSGYSGYLIQR